MESACTQLSFCKAFCAVFAYINVSYLSSSVLNSFQIDKVDGDQVGTQKSHISTPFHL